MRRPLALLAAAALLALCLAACHPTGSPRCDEILGNAGILQAIEDHGWIGANCAPPFAAPPSESGWANEDSTAKGAVPHTVYLWLGEIGSDNRVLIMVAGHEDGHVVQAMYGHPRDEARASTWSFCNWPQQGVGDGTGGYHAPPGGCAGFIP